MKHFNYLTAFAVTLLLGLFASCAPKDTEVEEATLSLSATAVTIANAGGEAQAITVTTNQAKWNAISNVEWLKTKIAGNALTIVATPNQGGADRAAEILVVAGATSEKISVVQSAADIVLEVSPENIVVANAGETKLISIKSNSATWTLEVDEAASAWIKQTVFKDFIQLEVAPNDGAARETKIYAKSGKTQKEITVQQAGKGGNKFLLPYLVLDAKQYDLLSYETKMGSFLVSYSPKNAGFPAFGIPPSGASYSFVTSSEIFPTVFYAYDYDTDMIQVIEYVGAAEKTTKVVADEGFVDFLKANGFEDAKYDEAKNMITGSHKTNRFTVTVGDSKQKVAVLHFNAPAPEQDKPYPTFKKFPWDKSEVLGNSQWTGDKLIKAEEDAGSTIEKTYLEKFPTVLSNFTATLKKSSDRDVPYIRLYFMDADKEKGSINDFAKQLLVVWTDVKLAFWDFKGKNYITKEFKDMYEKEGFEYLQDDPQSGGIFLVHKTKKLNGAELIYLVRPVRFKDVLDGQLVLAFNIWYEDVDGSSASASADKLLKKLSATANEMDKSLGIIK